MSRNRRKPKTLPETLQSIESVTGAAGPTPDSAADGAIEWEPIPGPQEAAYHTEADETLYGGQAGGGKTDLLLGLALTKHVNSIIFRREYSQMKGPKGILARAEELVGDYGSLNRNQKVFRNLPGGRTLEFGACQYENDVQGYKGRAHDLKAFDELVDFTQFQYEFLITWTRSVLPGVKPRVIGATNPPVDETGSWVIDAWAPWIDEDYPGDPAQPGELRWFVRGADDEYVWVDGPDDVREIDGIEREPRSRTFIPAELSDNPYLRDSGYRRTLVNLPSEFRAAYLDGEWTVLKSDKPNQVIPKDWVQAAQDRGEALLDEFDRSETPMSTMGADVNYGGDDDTILAPRYGPVVPELIKMPDAYVENTDTIGKQIATFIATKWREGALIIVDVVGWGSSTYEALVDSEMPVFPYNSAEKTEFTDRSGMLEFRNVRSAAHWNLRQLLDPDTEDQIALPPGRDLRLELCAATWRNSPSGVIIEDKDSIRERLGRSPDRADAVVMAFWPVSSASSAYRSMSG